MIIRLSFNHGCVFVALLLVFSAVQAHAELPPDAQEAVKKGVFAAQDQDYLLAVRYFQDARKIAPDAAEIFYDLGLAESKIPGRELRAICWFEAYLTADKNAPNAAAVKDQIDELDVKSQSNLSSLIKSVQDSGSQILQINHTFTNDNVSRHLYYLVSAQTEAGDIAGAIKTADLMTNDDVRHDSAWQEIGFAQAEAGDFAGAIQTANSFTSDVTKDTDKGMVMSKVADYQDRMAEAQAKAGDIAAALRTADPILDQGDKDRAYAVIAEAQAEAGDMTGMQKTVNQIQDAGWKKNVQVIVALQAKMKPGITAASQTPIQPAVAPIPVSDWINKLDDNNDNDDCPLNAQVFLDPSGYLKSQHSDDPQDLLSALSYTASKIAEAQNVIDGMLKQTGKG